MANMTETLPLPKINAARWAVFMLFLWHGLLIGAWVPLIPLVKDRLAVGPAVFGVALLSIAVGSIFSMPFTGALINRFGSAGMTLAGGLLLVIGFLGPVFAPNLATFMAGGFAMGLGLGSMDVSMNTHGIAVEKALGKPILSVLHAAWSVGCTAGAFAGSWLLQHYGAVIEALIFDGIFLVGVVTACFYLLPSSVDKGLSESHFGWPTRHTVALGALCFMALMVEGSVADWAGIHNKERFAVDASMAALGFAFYQGGMSISRFAGDWLRHKYGAVNVIVVSAVIAAIGMSGALLAPDLYTAIIGYCIGGLGIGNLAPVLFAGGGRLEPDAPARGMAAVVSMGYSGFLAGPPLIGFVAQVTSLSASLWLTVLGAIIIAVFARRVAPKADY
ncbi:MFS transporter [Aestuariivirga litoralis]|uniref:MFS transporter n=1 Tax=Aestuariivirga litoralis TaxID=2650924 RepID=UPI0018C575BD|nr:MFS transporter [Aestuariivirga litoralis]MBG1230874.1 MFS transporter [Aestuariivirga litoralis]